MTNVHQKSAALAAALALVLGLVGCGSGTDTLAIAATTVGQGPGFRPDTLTVDKENTVRVKVGNGTQGEHGFAIEGYKVKRTVNPNETVEVKFRASRAGTFKIYCQLHPAHQTGTLVVR